VGAGHPDPLTDRNLHGLEIHQVVSSEVSALRLGDLSDFFNPFLRHFVEGALGAGGEVWVSIDGGKVNGLLLYNHVEEVGSIFTRVRSVAESLYGLKKRAAMYSDFPLGASVETYLVLAVEAPFRMAAHRFRHPVRMARVTDRPAVARMLVEMYGRIDTSWLDIVPPREEACLVVEIDHAIAGAGWISLANGQGRLHSLSVRPRFRRIGVGTDLVHARIGWAREAGAQRVLTEISEQNVASLAIAMGGGMQRRGQIYLSGPSPVPLPSH
jgi:GNAT superfamily N-acetyltransferase